MGSVPPLLSFLLAIVSGWVHRHQLLVIEFLQAENRLLKERLRGKRIRFTDAERALLARKAKAGGRKALNSLLANHNSHSVCGRLASAEATRRNVPTLTRRQADGPPARKHPAIKAQSGRRRISLPSCV